MEWKEVSRRSIAHQITTDKNMTPLGEVTSDDMLDWLVSRGVLRVWKQKPFYQLDFDKYLEQRQRAFDIIIENKDYYQRFKDNRKVIKPIEIMYTAKSGQLAYMKRDYMEISKYLEELETIDMETLLKDPSYLEIENLFKIWTEKIGQPQKTMLY